MEITSYKGVGETNHNVEKTVEQFESLPWFSPVGELVSADTRKALRVGAPGRKNGQDPQH